MVLASRAKAWLVAGICTLTSVAGALVGYAIGAFAFQTVGEPLLAMYGYTERFESFASDYNSYGAWAVLVAGITPFPFKVITILSGATALGLPEFVLSCFIARGARFFVVAGLLWWIGPPIRSFVEARLGVLSGAIVVAAAVVVVVLLLLT